MADMNFLLLAAQDIPLGEPEGWLQLVLALTSGVGYATVFSSSRVAERASKDAVLSSKLPEALADALARANRQLQLVDEILEAPPEGQKYTIIEHRNKLSQRVDELESQAQNLASSQLDSAMRCRRWADWMLILMLVGIAGGTALVIMNVFVTASLVYGIAPTAFIAYWRLKNAMKDASEMAHGEKMRLLEYDDKKLELDHKRQDLELTRETKRLELVQKRIELNAATEPEPGRS